MCGWYQMLLSVSSLFHEIVSYWSPGMGATELGNKMLKASANRHSTAHDMNNKVCAEEALTLRPCMALSI